MKLCQGGLGQRLGKCPYCKNDQTLEQAAKGDGGVTVPGDVQEQCGHGTSGHGLIAMVVLGQFNDLKGLSQLKQINDSMMP